MRRPFIKVNGLGFYLTKHKQGTYYFRVPFFEKSEGGDSMKTVILLAAFTLLSLVAAAAATAASWAT
ncbi:MAG: hypothetical protein HYW00_02450 [Candidatus Colwellbacteria bacterium]|nr:hypothetical protein [Candidatus Colwellbacteria bacterium]